jgi:transposase
MKATRSPRRSVIEIFDDELASADEQFAALVGTDPIVKRLTTVPGVGPITATAFVAALDVASRFERASQVTSYLGLVPREDSSGEPQRRGRVMRSAPPHLQSLLVQAAWRVWRGTDPRTEAFGRWAQVLARRRGKKVAVVALARRLARTLFAMWRDEADDQPRRLRTRGTQPVAEATAETGVSVPMYVCEVVKLEGQARTDVWPHVRAVLKRAPLLLRILLCAGTSGARQERE